MAALVPEDEDRDDGGNGDDGCNNGSNYNDNNELLSGEVDGVGPKFSANSDDEPDDGSRGNGAWSRLCCSGCGLVSWVNNDDKLGLLCASNAAC